MTNLFFRMTIFHFMICLFCIPSLSAQQKESPADTFGRGVQEYGAKEFEKAVSSFSEALNTDPNNPDILVNLANAYAQLGKKGHAIAYFSKALVQDFHNPQALAGKEFVTSQLAIKELPHQIEFFESIKADYLSEINPALFYLFTFLLLGCCGVFWIFWISQRKLAIANDQTPPPVRTSLVLLSLVSLIFIFFSVAQISEGFVARAIILPEKLNVLSGPTDSAVELFEISWGLEVKVLQTQNDWVQISYPGGSSGWVKKDSVIIFKGGS